MGRLLIAWMLVASAAGGSNPAQASTFAATFGHERDPWGMSPAYRYGYDRGWRQGSEVGHRDGRDRRAPRHGRGAGSRDGDRGYSPWMGPRYDYATGFRHGYVAGYRRAYAAARPDRRVHDGGGSDGRPRPHEDDRYVDEHP